MTYSRRQFQESLRDRVEKTKTQRRADLRFLAQAEVPIEALTHSAEWDYFLSLLQAKVEEFEGVLGSLREAFSHSPSFDHAQLAAEKAAMIRLDSMRQALLAVIELPSQIKTMGELAKLDLDDTPEE